MWAIIGGVIAVAAGVYVGLGMPGLPGRDNRVVKPGRRRKIAKHRFLDWLRPPDSRGGRRR